MQSRILVHHKRKAKLIQPFTMNSNTQHTLAMCYHKVYNIRSYIFCCTNKISLIFSLFIINNNDDFSVFNFFYCFFNITKHFLCPYLFLNQALTSLLVKTVEIAERSILIFTFSEIASRTVFSSSPAITP